MKWLIKSCSSLVYDFLSLFLFFLSSLSLNIFLYLSVYVSFIYLYFSIGPYISPSHALKDRASGLLLQDAEQYINESYDAISVTLLACMCRKFKV